MSINKVPCKYCKIQGLHWVKRNEKNILVWDDEQQHTIDECKKLQNKELTFVEVLKMHKTQTQFVQSTGNHVIHKTQSQLTQTATTPQVQPYPELRGLMEGIWQKLENFEKQLHTMAEIQDGIAQKVELLIARDGYPEPHTIVPSIQPEDKQLAEQEKEEEGIWKGWHSEGVVKCAKCANLVKSGYVFETNETEVRFCDNCYTEIASGKDISKSTKKEKEEPEPEQKNSEYYGLDGRLNYKMVNPNSWEHFAVDVTEDNIEPVKCNNCKNTKLAGFINKSIPDPLGVNEGYISCDTCYIYNYGYEVFQEMGGGKKGEKPLSEHTKFEESEFAQQE